MQIIKAVFEKSSNSLSQCTSSLRPEFAFIGRSNVGKSSLINMITGFHNLAKTSGTPGKTRLINHFLINDHWYLVDLPGYGYAKIGKKQKGHFNQLINDYVLKRKQLFCLFVLIDIRIDPQMIDLEFINWLGMNQVPFAIVFTKTDKVSPDKLSRNIKNFQHSLLKYWESLPPFFNVSSVLKKGREELLNYIMSLLSGQ